MSGMTQEKPLDRELPGGILQWYEFGRDVHGLFVEGGEECFDALPESLREQGVMIDRAGPESLKGLGEKNYDFIVAAGALERSRQPLKFLKNLHRLLKPDGILLMGAHNRLSIRSFCGDRDPFTERNFDGIEDYSRVSKTEQEKIKGRAYAKAELTDMLKAAGFKYHRFYSVLPEWTRAQMLCREDCLPEARLMEQIIPQYHSPDTVFLEEEQLYGTLVKNGLFHATSNGYLIECPLDGRFTDMRQALLSVESGREEAMVSLLRGDGRVEKKALYREGRGKPERMFRYAADLRDHGIRTAELKLEQGALITAPVKGQGGLDYFRKLACEDKETFLKELDRFMELIENSSEQVPYEEVNWEHFDPDWQRRKRDDPGKDKWKNIALSSQGKSEQLGIILKNGYMDLIPGNCVYDNGEFVFFDQEWCEEQLPVHVIRLRAIDQIYWGRVWERALIAKEDLIERYHIQEYKRLWQAYLGRFTERIRGDKELLEYHQRCRRDWRIVSANRYRMNYSENEYERVFKDIFRGTQGRQLYLFGSGIFAEKFLEQFGDDCDVKGILDNNEERWGKTLSGIEIFPPEIALTLPRDSYKIIVCVKYCAPILEQLRGMGILDYSVYDWHQEYQRKLPRPAETLPDEKAEPKKYHVGYIAGVFDLFHVGHLNMFKRAKEQCDYLIVGVVSDESVMVNKKTMPYMPFEERIELVRSCRYVDEAVELPTYNGDTDEAFRRYQFDVQFSGSDYAGDPVWLAKKAYLEKRGAKMVFFPYTDSTSSTKLKEMIERGLL